MIKKISTIFLLIFSFYNIYAQEVIWEKSYLPKSVDYAGPKIIHITSDNNIIVTGEFTNSELKNIPFIVKLDKNGNILWEKTIERDNPLEIDVIYENNQKNKLTLLSDYALNWNVAYRGVYALYNMELDLKSEEVVYENYDSASKHRIIDDSPGVNFVKSSGNIIKIFRYGMPSEKDSLITRNYDKSGNFLSERIIDTASKSGIKLYPQEISDFDNDSKIIAGRISRNDGGNTSYFLLKINNNGSKIWRKNYQEEIDFYDIEKLNDKLILLGRANDDNHKFIKLFDNKGNLIDEKILGNDSLKVYDISITKDNGLIIAGGYYDQPRKFRLIKFDKNLKNEWEKNWTYNDSSGILINVSQMVNGDFIVSGSMWGKIYIARIKKQTSGVKEYSRQDKIKLFPNPSEGTFSLFFESAMKGKFNLIIHDGLGKEVYKLKFDKNQNFITLPIDLGSLTNGSYFYNIMKDGEKVTNGIFNILK